MYLIGLTGGIASGKSTVSKMLKQKGAQIIDADRLAREAVFPGEAAWRQIVDWLGESILLEDRSIDRVQLGKLIFNDPEMRKKLNEIVHPRVGQALLLRTKEIRDWDPEAVIVYDVPLLIEAGMQGMVSLVILVYVSPGIQLQRLQHRDGLSREDALARINSQMPLEEKKKHAHVIIDNSASLEDTSRQVDLLWPRCQSLT